MRHRGGGVGHSTRAFTRDLEREATEDDKPLPVYDGETGEMLQDVPEDPEGEEDEETEESEAKSPDAGPSAFALSPQLPPCPTMSTF